MHNISRRKLLKNASKAAAVTMFYSLSKASGNIEKSPYPANWILGMQGAKTMDCTLAKEIEILSSLGYDGLELRDWKLNAFLREWSVDELVHRLNRTGLKPFNISAIELTSLGPCPERDNMKERHKWYFETASKLNCPSAMFVHFTTIHEGISHKKKIQLAADDLKYMSDLAGKYNVKVLYEFLGSKKLPINNINDTMEMINLADRKNVGWILDLYHFQVTDLSLESLKKAGSNSLSIVHLCDVKNLPYEKLAVPLSERTMPGEGICDNQKILGTLKKIGYEGPFVVELYNNEFMKMNPRQFAVVAKEKSENILNTYFNKSS